VLYRYRWALWLAVLVVGAAIGAALAFSRSSGKADEKTPPPDKGFTWAAGTKPAPNFNLVDENSRAISLHGLRGRPVLVTFMDPVCRNLCPLEAKALISAVSALPAAQRPPIIAVSVNRWANGRPTLRRAMKKWKVSPSWHWAVGKPAALRGVWNAYGIGVRDDGRTIDGITVHNISHTEATYVVDRNGYERALFMWPFRAEDVKRAVQRLG
jgi:cytochrome oxidase Cu insertion factor (SCO1/SenC/PrrC family)